MTKVAADSLIFVLELILLTSIDGRAVYINPEQVVSFAASRDNFAKGGRCTITLADGKFVAVAENCDDVRRKLER